MTKNTEDSRNLEDTLPGALVDTSQIPNLFSNHDNGNRPPPPVNNTNHGGHPPMGQPGPPQGVTSKKGMLPMGPHHEPGGNMNLAQPTKMSPSSHQNPNDINPSANGSTGRKYQCKMCPQIFMHKSAMQHHSREAHRGDIKPYQCQQCLKSFSSNHQLLQHIRIHTGEKPYKCSYCDRRFKQLSHVQQHTRLHTGERPYKCPIPDCNRAFIQLSNLQQHLRNHDSQMERAKNRPYVCNTCGKCFATDSSLRTHGSKQHVALVCNPFTQVCPMCHKSFINSEAVLEHMHIMHKELGQQHQQQQQQQQQQPPQQAMSSKRRSSINHPCPLCGKSYVNEGSLRKHISSHQDPAAAAAALPCPPLRMWPCTVCQNVFTQEAGLLHHMEAMRTDPRHQFAAQYLLSRAAAERRLKEEHHSMASSSSVVPSSSSGEPVHLQQQPHPADVLQQPLTNSSLMPSLPPQLAPPPQRLPQPQQQNQPELGASSNCTTSDSENDPTSPSQVASSENLQHQQQQQQQHHPQQHFQNMLH